MDFLNKARKKAEAAYKEISALTADPGPLNSHAKVESSIKVRKSRKQSQ